MRFRLLCLLLPFVVISPATTQTSSSSSSIDSAGTSTTTFERLQAKNRSRLFSDTPSPRGEHYVYLDDSNLTSGEGIAPEIQVQPGTRGVKTVIHSFTPNRLILMGDEESIGTVRLLEAESAPREIHLETTVDLQHPLRIRVRERIHKESDQREPSEGGGGQ